MPKIRVTPQQRANALEALNVMWPSIRPEQVSHRLYTWREQPGADGTLSSDDVDLNKPPTCGSVACFGGWLEWWPPFRQQLNANPDSGELEIDHLNDLLGAAGTGMFSERNRPLGDRFWAGCPADVDFEGTDHELVTNRLKWLIENSEVAG